MHRIRRRLGRITICLMAVAGSAAAVTPSASAREYEPAPIRQLARELATVFPGARCVCIVGDAKHRSGYHRGANYVSPNDYSRRLAPDRINVDGEAAAALDIALTAQQLRLATARLKASAENPRDGRLSGIREFAGTLDSRRVFHYDEWFERGDLDRWDRSHLSHLHISFLRSQVSNSAVMRDVLSVLRGDRWPPPPGRMRPV